MRAAPIRLRRVFRDLRTEGAGAVREPAAVALGIFIGCLPLYGLHTVICWALGYALRLNRLKMYLASNISNPLVAPWLIVAEVQTGAWLRRGALHPLSFESIASTGIAVFFLDALAGSLLVGGVLAVLAATGTYLLVRGSAGDRSFADLVGRTSDRYLAVGIAAWELARGALRIDPIHRTMLSPDVLPSGGTLLDIGCGRGVTLALLSEARRASDEGRWPEAWPQPPRFDRLVGIEQRRRAAMVARDALDGEAEVIEGDARTTPLVAADAVLVIDVLHFLRAAEQEVLLGALAARLAPDGVVLVREADPGAGLRFRAVRTGAFLTRLLSGAWKPHASHFRTPAEWRACFTRHGFRTEMRAIGDGGLFSNELFRLTPEPDASGPVVQPSLPA
jgi:uncharacterized protein (DUF2062 family)/SAM-dependent methyltransferase